LSGAPETARRSRLGPVLWRAGLSFGVLALLLWWLPTGQLVTAISRVPITVWAIVVAGFVLGHAIAALKWRVLLRATGVDVPVGEVLRAHAAGLFANLCLPSLVGGDVVRAILVSHSQRGIERVVLAGLTDRINDTFALLLLAGAGALLVPHPPDSGVLRFMLAAAILLPLGAVAAVIAVMWIPTGRLPAVFAKVHDKLRDGLRNLSRAPFLTLWAGSLSVAIQALFVGLNVMLARAMGIEIAVAIWFLAWPLAKLIAMAPVSLGGMGVRELALAGLLAPFGVASADAVAQSLGWEAVLVASGLAAGALAIATGARIPLGRSSTREGAAV
jgi:uncharacterized membrane protein YbhN (UPF0104 family)